MRTSIAVITVLTWFVSVATADAAQKYKGFARGGSLITVGELKQLIDAKDAKLVVLAVVEPLSFAAGHIPTSVNVWRSDYELKAGQGYPFEGMLLGREAFQTLARALGVSNDSRVVVYDDKYDATRLWWAFYWYGKTDVQVLDGGYPAWKAAGYETAMSLSRGRDVKPGHFLARERPSGWFARMNDVWRGQTSRAVRVWDVRELDEWTGAEKKGTARRAGRIPWATFQHWANYRITVDGKHTAFKTASEIQKLIDEFRMDPQDSHIFYCHSGVRSTTPIFALYLMGWNPERLYNYDGSWLEWSYHESNPLATGR